MIELTKDSAWQYRLVVNGQPQPWADTVPATRTRVDWPVEWSRNGTPVRADERGVIDLGALRSRREAELTTVIHCATDRELIVHTGADWRMEWFVDGQPVFNTLARGNRGPLLQTPHEFPLRLTAGRHELRVRVISGNGGWAFVSEATVATGVEPGPPFVVQAQRVFPVADPEQFAALAFVGPATGRARLNGAAIPVPLAGMRYRTVPAVPVSLLRPGENVLTKEWTAAESAAGARVAGLRFFQRPLHADDRLFGLTNDDARLQTGPILHHVGPDYLTVSCRTNLPRPVQTTVGATTVASASGLIHRLTVTGLQPATEYAFTILSRTARVRTLPAHGAVTFAILGDPSPQPHIWKQVAPVVLARRPDFAVFLGDMVSDGLLDDAWDEEFFNLTPDFFAQVPTYWLLGNHDRNAPLLDALLMMPGGGRNWTQPIGDLLLIGVDGAGDWSAGSANRTWLEQTLAAARAKFIFFCNHYPAWTSTAHGEVGDDGRPVERPIREAREVILPLLTQYQVTAFVSGHNHCYERSELPGGVTAISSGGAGGYLYDKHPDARLNPHSTVYASAYHYCLVTVAGDTCTLQAIGLDNTTLDTKYWRTRPTL
jgi:hypothetical protein